jgi:hypothetical protein
LIVSLLNILLFGFDTIGVQIDVKKPIIEIISGREWATVINATV